MLFFNEGKHYKLFGNVLQILICTIICESLPSVFFLFCYRAGLSLGSSRHWKDALEAITGERELSASAILEYFEPLHKYLKNENSKVSSASSLSAFVNIYILFIGYCLLSFVVSAICKY